MQITFGDGATSYMAIANIVAMIVVGWLAYLAGKHQAGTARSISNAQLNRRRADELTQTLARFLDEAHLTTAAMIMSNSLRKDSVAGSDQQDLDPEDPDDIRRALRDQERLLKDNESLLRHHQALRSIAYELQILLYGDRPDEQELIDAVQSLGAFSAAFLRQIEGGSEDEPEIDPKALFEVANRLLIKSRPVVRRLSENI